MITPALHSISDLYKFGAPYGEILQHCIGLNISEPLGMFQQGNQLKKNLTGVENEKFSDIRNDAVIQTSEG